MHPRGQFRIPARPTRRRSAAGAGLALALAALPALTGACPSVRATAARADVTTASQDAMRTGWDQNEPTGMTPATVPSFAERWRTTVGGQVYAQPLVIGNIVVVATENDWVYGLDRTTGTVVWQKHLGNAFVIGNASQTSLRTCHDLVPNIGITGTPAYDPGTGLVYLFANVVTGGSPHWYMYGINPATGAFGTPVSIGGHPANATKLTFNAQTQMERPGVLVLDGAVWAAFASHCDRTPYAGYMVRVNLATSGVTLWTDESGVAYNRAGIWQGGGGLMSDGSGRVFAVSGNGISPPTGATAPGGQLAESIMRIGVNSNGTLAAKDFFSPANASSLDASDTDYGAGGPAALPFSVGNYPHVLVQAGKDGRVFALNRDKLGGRSRTDAGALFWTKNYGGVWGHPAVFADTSTLTGATNSTANDLVFVVGKGNPLRVFRVFINGSGKPVLSNVAVGSLTYGYTSGSPVVTSNGTDPNSAVVWEVRSADATGAGGELDAYALGPLISTAAKTSACTSASQCTLRPIWHSTAAFTAAKFSIPATNAGWVYVGTRLGTNAQGQVIAYTAASTAAPVKSATAQFTPASVGGTSSQPVSVTATRNVTLTGMSASTSAANTTAPASSFTLPASATVTVTRGGKQHAATFPVTLHKGDRATATVDFRPAAPGLNQGALAFTTAAGPVTVPLSGEGTAAGLYPQPASVSFPLAPDQGVTDVPVGISKPEQVNITNFSTSAETVTSVTPPSAPFAAVSGLPVTGDVIKPGDTLSIQVNYNPSQAGGTPDRGSFTIATTGGSVTVPLSGESTPAVSAVQPASPVVDFGTVKAGQQATRYIYISNNGNTATTLQGTATLTGPFAQRLRPAAGLPFNPEYNLAIPVTFTPHHQGSFATQYKLTWTDLHGTHTLTVTLAGTAA
jgi:PQQ-like domain